MSEETTLDTKLIQLQLITTRTEKVLQSNKRETIERHLKALQTTISEADHLKRTVEQLKIREKQDIQEIGEWNANVEAKIAEAEDEVGRLQKWLNDKKREDENNAREEQLQFEIKLQETKLQVQAKLHEGKAEMSNSCEATKEIPVRLPKINIAKFEGAYMDWPRFWGQFTETVDKSNIAAINKFTYLCGSLGTKVRRSVEALPFTPEGYNRAKSILKDRYGKNSEITKAYVKEIMDLPHISSANPKKITEFGEKLNYCVQALQTMNKLNEVNGNVSMTLDKLPAIRGDLVRTDPEWESWNFAQLSEAIRQWTRRNPVDDKESEPPVWKKEKSKKMFHTKQGRATTCVYCDGEHKPTNCETVTDVKDRREILAKKKLCFNCASGLHRAASCTSKSMCRQCNRRHHTSICDSSDQQQQRSVDGGEERERVYTASGSGKNSEGVFPVVVVKVNGVKCRALIDSGAGSSYISAKLATMLKIKPSETRISRIDMMMASKTTRLEIYDAQIEALESDYVMDVKLIKVEKSELLTVDNPHYDKLKSEFGHLRAAKFSDVDQKSELPVHIVLGSGEYARIKTDTKPLVGIEGQPIAEKTKLGWFAMSPGIELNHNTMLLTQTTQKNYEVLRFTRVLFGLVSSPFLLGGVLEAHLEQWESKAPMAVAKLRERLYVDDIISGGNTIQEARLRKEEATEILGDATFSLHKWASNAKELEDSSDLEKENEEQTVAKQQLGVKPKETKILGVKWDKEKDTLSVQTAGEKTGNVTKRNILSRLAKIYDPMGIASPLLLQGKQIYREVCDFKLPWDTTLSGRLQKRWEKWESTLPPDVTVPRTIAPFHEQPEKLEIHGFGDASKEGLCAAVYTVVRQPSGATQGLLAVKSRLAKEGLTIPRLELVAGHMVTNIITNASKALRDIPHEKHGWLDNTVALWWIKGEDDYKQFVANRVAKIRAADGIEWHYVPTTENPADLGSRGGQLTKLWLEGPTWLQNPNQWPSNPVIKPTQETQVETKIRREVLSATMERAEQDPYGYLLRKHPLKRTLRIGAWIKRFVDNVRLAARQRRSGPLMTEELQQQRLWWIKQVQTQAKQDPKYEAEKIQLNLQPNTSGVLECHGRIQGKYPIYVPDRATFAEKLVEEAHQETLHGGVILTMAKIREKYWVPRLRRLVKKVKKKCWSCKRFTAKAYDAPNPGPLPKTRTEGTTPYKVIGVDFAGPIKYKGKKKQVGKAYLVLFSCSLTRGVYLELLRSLETAEFLQSLKRLIARRGRPALIYSDNGKTFKAAATWLQKVRKDEKFHDQLSKYEIQWQFNLSRAPWWGGQFERLIGIFKSSFYRVIGGGFLTFEELAEAVLDVEICMNNRPLSYLEDDVDFPVLTPNSFLLQRPNDLLEVQAHQTEDSDLRKRAKYIKKMKDSLWKRWTREYLTSLREKHKSESKRKQKRSYPCEGNIVIIKGDGKNRNQWRIGKVTKLIRGKDQVVRGVRLQTAKGNLERPIQLIYPLELQCDISQPKQLDAQATEFRPRRQAAAVAEAVNEAIMEYESD